MKRMGMGLGTAAKVALVGVVLAGVAPGLALAEAGLETIEAIEACVDANQPQETAVQTVALYATDRGGSVTESRAELYWQKFDNGLSKVMMRFSDPPDLRGAAMLMLERKSGSATMLMYLPELEKVRRITNRMISGSMFGTDFSYEDFERLQGVSGDSDTERLPDEEIEGRSYYVLREIPKDDGGYESITSWIDQETCVPHRTEFREEGGQLRKLALVDPKKVTRHGEMWIPGEMVIRDLLNETHTRLEVEKIEIGGKIPRKMFSERELSKGH